MQNNYALMYLLGQTLYFHGKKTEANKYFTEGLKWADLELQKDTSNPELYAQRGLCYARLGRRSQAIEAATRGANFGEHQDRIAARLANIYAILDDKKEVLRWLDNAKQLSPNDYDLA